jgi:hypothetical protein
MEALEWRFRSDIPKNFISAGVDITNLGLYSTLQRYDFTMSIGPRRVFNQSLGTLTKVQSVSRPCFRSENDELIIAMGCLAENRAFFGWADKCL